MHSAEDLAAFVTVPVVVKVHPAVISAMVTVNVLLDLPLGSRARNPNSPKNPVLLELPVYVTVAEILSFGLTVADTDLPEEMLMAELIMTIPAG
jgi:hypothetical protein